MKKLSKPVIILQVLVVVAVIGAAIFFFTNSTGGTKLSSSEIEKRLEAVEKLDKDNKQQADLAKFATDYTYDVYEPSTFDNSYAYYRETQEVVKNSFDNVEYPEEVFYFMKNMNDEDNHSTRLIYKKSYEDTSISVSNYMQQENTLLVEKKIYTDCSKDECVSENNSVEVHYDQYLYNIENNTLAPINEENAGELELSDVSSNLNDYFKELFRLYNM